MSLLPLFVPSPQAFPDVERMHKAKQLDKMMGKGLWGVRAERGLGQGCLRPPPHARVPATRACPALHPPPTTP